MSNSARPLKFVDLLPEVFRPAGADSNLTKFLKAFEQAFEELQSEIEGARDLSSGGVPDLFSPDTTPPSQFAHAGGGDFDFLSYLASWIALPLRPDKDVAWNRTFFQKAIKFYPHRGTRAGMEEMLQAWLDGDLIKTDPPLSIVTDFTPPVNSATAVFQLGVTATLGVDTVLGLGPPFLFAANLVLDPAQKALRAPAGIETVQRAARLMLDAEKPAHTYYWLAVRAATMQLAAPGETDINGNPAAQIGLTMLLWQEPWVFVRE